MKQNKKLIIGGAVIGLFLLGGIVSHLGSKPGAASELTSGHTEAEAEKYTALDPEESADHAHGVTHGVHGRTDAAPQKHGDDPRKPGTPVVGIVKPGDAAHVTRDAHVKGAPADSAHRAAGDVAKGAPTDVAKGAPADVTKGVPGDIAKGAPADAASGVGFLGALKSKLSGFFGGAGKEAAKDAPETAAKKGLLDGLVGEDSTQKEEPKIDISRNCYTETFEHKPLKSHNSGEACAHHRNTVKISQTDYNAKSVCVRVNGNPVRFQTGKKGEFHLGPIAGPTAKITVRYCMQKAKISACEDCSIPKDDFMEAIGGIADDGSEGAAYVKWDPSDAGQDDDVTAQLDPELRRELANATDMKLFDGWVKKEEAPACGTKTASSQDLLPANNS